MKKTEHLDKEKGNAMPRFCMPYNCDTKLIDAVLAEYVDYVPSFYGSMGGDPFGGGRALADTQRQTLDSFRNTVARLEHRGIEFNYVMNSASMLNREFSPEYREKYKSFLNTLQSVGVHTITLSNIFLIELTKEHVPDWKISASVNLKTCTPEEVRFLLALGCGEITLHYNILKDAKALKQIRKETNIDLKLIPNDIYIRDCPWQKGHTRMQAAHSRDKGFKTPYFSYYRNKCVNLRQLKPEEVLKAMWIPPDQLWRYETLGYDYFKMLDRLATTDWNLRTLKTYIEAKPLDQLETLVGTYGASATNLLPDSFEGDTRPYPKEKLEVTPTITSAESSRIFSYFLNDAHMEQCGSCRTCFKAVASSVQFREDARLRAVENNRQWQAQITKLSFIKSLEGSNRRIQYG